MAIYKYKSGGRGSLYVLGEEIPPNKLKNKICKKCNKCKMCKNCKK